MHAINLPLHVPGPPPLVTVTICKVTQVHRKITVVVQGSIPYVPLLRAPYYVWIGRVPQLATIMAETKTEAPSGFPATFLYTQSWEDPRPDMQVTTLTHERAHTIPICFSLGTTFSVHVTLINALFVQVLHYILLYILPVANWPIGCMLTITLCISICVSSSAHAPTVLVALSWPFHQTELILLYAKGSQQSFLNRVELIVYTLGACWRSEASWNTPCRYLALTGKPAVIVTTLYQSWP